MQHLQILSFFAETLLPRELNLQRNTLQLLSKIENLKLFIAFL